MGLVHALGVGASDGEVQLEDHEGYLKHNNYKQGLLLLGIHSTKIGNPFTTICRVGLSLKQRLILIVSLHESIRLQIETLVLILRDVEARVVPVASNDLSVVVNGLLDHSIDAGHGWVVIVVHFLPAIGLRLRYLGQ